MRFVFCGCEEQGDKWDGNPFPAMAVFAADGRFLLRFCCAEIAQQKLHIPIYFSVLMC